MLGVSFPSQFNPLRILANMLQVRVVIPPLSPSSRAVSAPGGVKLDLIVHNTGLRTTRTALSQKSAAFFWAITRPFIGVRAMWAPGILLSEGGLPNRSRAHLEPVSSAPNTEIRIWRAETAAVKPGPASQSLKISRLRFPHKNLTHGNIKALYRQGSQAAEIGLVG